MPAVISRSADLTSPSPALTSTQQRLLAPGRILAVADIYEALTADRPYRNSMPQEKVEAIMNSMLGPGICTDCYEALGRWRQRAEVTSRVEAQLEAIEKLHSELA